MWWLVNLACLSILSAPSLSLPPSLTLPISLPRPGEGTSGCHWSLSPSGSVNQASLTSGYQPHNLKQSKKPAPATVHFLCNGATMSGITFELSNDAYKVSLLKNKCLSGDPILWCYISNCLIIVKCKRSILTITTTGIVCTVNARQWSLCNQGMKN